MVPQSSQSRAEEGSDLAIPTSGFCLHCMSLQGTSVVISHYSAAGGSTSLRYTHLPSKTGRCQQPPVWQHALTWIGGESGIASSVTAYREAACKGVHRAGCPMERAQTHRGRKEMQGGGGGRSAFIWCCSWALYCEATALIFQLCSSPCSLVSITSLNC